jgi:putative transposase
VTFQLIDQERAHHAVSRLCSVLNVSRQGYWAWKRRPPSRRRVEDELLKPLIRQAWRASDETYGAPRLHAELRLGDGVRVGKKRVARLMREQGIQGVSRRRGRVRSTTPAPLVVDAISMAISRRKPKPGLVHHSDRGSQYTSIAMGRTLRDSKIMASMGSKGDPWDNACAESCISTIKNELVKRRTFQTRDQARLALFRYIESFYNPLRRHSSLEMLSPNDYEARYWEDNAAATAA